MLDQEVPDLPVEAVRAHVGSCPACAGWAEEAGRVSRLVRLAPAQPMPDLAPLVVPPVLRPARQRVTTAIRSALVVVAIVQALLAWSGALTGHDSMASGHLAEETGAWNLAIAVAFLTAATRPRTAGALVAPIGVFVAVLFVTAAGDVVADAIDGARIAAHLVVAVGLALLVVVSRTASTVPGGTPSRRVAGRPGTPAPAGPPLLAAVPAAAGPAPSAGTARSAA